MHGVAEQETLHQVTALISKEKHLLVIFNTLCNHVQSQAFTQGNNGLGDGGAVLIRGYVLHKGLINLKGIERESFQITERRISGTEVVYR